MCYNIHSCVHMHTHTQHIHVHKRFLKEIKTCRRDHSAFIFKSQVAKKQLSTNSKKDQFCLHKYRFRHTQKNGNLNDWLGRGEGNQEWLCRDFLGGNEKTPEFGSDDSYTVLNMIKKKKEMQLYTSKGWLTFTVREVEMDETRFSMAIKNKTNDYYVQHDKKKKNLPWCLCEAI